MRTIHWIFSCLVCCDTQKTHSHRCHQNSRPTVGYIRSFYGNKLTTTRNIPHMGGMNTPPRYPASDQPEANPRQTARTSQVSVEDQRAFEAATIRLRNALARSAQSGSQSEVAEARISLRSLAVKLRDVGFWKYDKQGLRATVSLLWEADRFVSDRALLQTGDPQAQ